MKNGIRGWLGARGLALILAGAAGASCASAGEDGGRPVEPPETAASVWALTEPPSTGVCGMRASSLAVTAIKLDAGWVYLHASHSTDHAGAEPDAPQTPITAEYLAKGKPNGVASATGVASQNQGGWLAVAMADLPAGQFDLVVHALGLQATVRLEKAGGKLKRITARHRDDLIWADDSVGVVADSDVTSEVE